MASFANAPIVEQTLADLQNRLQVLDASISTPLLQRWAQQLELPLLQPKPVFAFADVVADVRRRASAVANEQQLNLLMQQISQGLEAPPAAPAPAPAPAPAAATTGKAAGVTSAQISEMIQQLKNGQITQTQLYSQLSGLYAQAPASDEAPVNSTDRRNALEQMMQQRRQPEAAAPSDASLWNALGLSATGAAKASAAAQAAQFNTSFRSSMSEEPDDESALAQEIKALQVEIARTQNEFVGGRLNQAVNAAQEDRLQREIKIRDQLEAAHLYEGEAYGSDDYGSGDDEPKINHRPRTAPPARNHSRSQTQLASSASVKQLTDRMKKWQEKIRTRAEMLKEELVIHETDGCTFRPEINTKSRNLTEGVAQNHRKVFTRSRARAKMSEAEIKRQEEQKLRESCTFRPSINPKSARIASNVMNRSLDVDDVNTASTARLFQREDPIVATMAECTFAPKVNNIKNNMHTAAMYLQQSPFERLHNGTGAVAVLHEQAAMLSPRESSHFDFDPKSPQSARVRGKHGNKQSQSHLFTLQKQAPLSPVNLLGGRSQSNSLFTSASMDQLALMSSSSMAKLHVGAEGEKKKVSMTEFMARQRAREEQKQQNLERIKAYSEIDLGHPQLNRKSMEIASRKNNKSFLDRLEDNLERNREREAQREAQRNHVECTFQPHINPKSKNRPARPLDEMCHGDLQRLETKRKILIMAEEERELESATFRPIINHTPVESFLRIRDDADSYVDRITERSKELEDRVNKLKMESERRELEECTFHPQVKDAPAFVKRIARSVQLTREPNAAAPATQEAQVGWK